MPSAVYVVAKGTDLAAYGRSNRLDEASPIFLRDGYISINFNIETIRNADLNNPHLQYIHGPLNNQWWDMEGFDGTDGVRDRIMTDPYGVQFIFEMAMSFSMMPIDLQMMISLPMEHINKVLKRKGELSPYLGTDLKWNPWS